MPPGQRARPDGGPAIAEGGAYFNAAAFARAPQFAFGTAGRTVPDVLNPGTVNWDVLIEKRFSITGRVALDFPD